GSQSLARTLECDDPNGLSRSPERPDPHYVVMPSPIGVSSFTLRVNSGSLISFTTNHDCPSHPVDLIGKSNGGDLCRSAAHDAREPEPLGAVPSSIENAWDAQLLYFGVSFSLIGRPINMLADLGNILICVSRLYIDNQTLPIRRSNQPPV